MTKPDDIPQWAWDDANNSIVCNRVSITDYEFDVLSRAIARSLMAAHAKGQAEQREVDAKIADGLGSPEWDGGDGGRFGHGWENACETIAEDIRKGD